LELLTQQLDGKFERKQEINNCFTFEFSKKELLLN
jgi:hypothetical protein